MAENSDFRIYKTNEEKIETILTNVLLMLSRRIYVDKKDEKHQLYDISTRSKTVKAEEDDIYVIETRDGNLYALKIMFQVISSTGKQPAVMDYVNSYSSHKKILVATSYVPKIAEVMSKNNVQIFSEHYFLGDLLEVKNQPRFELLTSKEMAQVKQEYNFTNEEATHYKRSDIVVKYFALKKGDVIRIERPSPTAGVSIAYRVVS